MRRPFRMDEWSIHDDEGAEAMGDQGRAEMLDLVRHAHLVVVCTLDLPTETFRERIGAWLPVEMSHGTQVALIRGFLEHTKDVIDDALEDLDQESSS